MLCRRLLGRPASESWVYVIYALLRLADVIEMHHQDHRARRGEAFVERVDLAHGAKRRGIDDAGGDAGGQQRSRRWVPLRPGHELEEIGDGQVGEGNGGQGRDCTADTRIFSPISRSV